MIFFKNILLKIIQFIHLLIDLFCMFYIFLFNPIYDIYFSGFVLLQTIHWALLKNECIVSYIEKKLINSNYKLGDNPKWIPHYSVYHNKFTILLKAILILGALLLVTFRNKHNYILYICIAAFILWIYFTYLHHKSHI